MGREGPNGSASVPFLLAPFGVVGPPTLDERTATIQCFLLSFLSFEGPVAVKTLPPEFRLFLGFH